MRILALEFSSAQRSVAWHDHEGRLRQVADVIEPETRGTTAFALLDQLLQGNREIDLVAVGLGPGSYAGIRAAISIAQGWQLAKEVPVVGISSMTAMAQEVPARGQVHLAIDAQRGEFYLGTYLVDDSDVKEVRPIRLASAEEIRTLLGTGQPVFGPELPEALGGGIKLYPTATAVARLATGGVKPIPAENLEPIYLRPTQFVKLGSTHRST